MIRTGHAPSSLRDPGLLAGALARPRNRAHYEQIDLIEQASTLIVAVAKAHPFIDGNKRTAMQLGIQFLDINGLEFTGDSELLAVLVEESVEMTSHDDGIVHIDQWLRLFIQSGH